MLNLLRIPTLIVICLASTAAHSHSNHGPGSAVTADSLSGVATSGAPVLSSSSLSSSILGNATCQSRTANYITHTLPQQCLRTKRSSPLSGSTIANPTSGSTANATDTDVFSTPPLSTGISAHSSSVVSSAAAAGLEQSTSTVVVVSSPTSSESILPTLQQPEAEADSPLDNAKFLSFEEWKKENLAKVGQSPENLGGRSQPIDADRRRPGINHALDTLGEESEIELDFSGFGGGYENVGDHSSSQTTPGNADVAQSSRAQPTLRSKDAGKTCKERTNYASFDCAATILKSNLEAKSGSSILVENKDSYLLNKCSAKNKFIIVELCNDILVDTLVLASYEYFSSIFRHFRVSVSDRYPVKMEKWKDLGTFEARNTREVQAFLIENPLIWARYLRIEFMTHYGNEYYCPVSLLRVHGTTMMDEFRHQEELARGEPQDEEVALETEVAAQPAIGQDPDVASQEASKETVQAIPTTSSEAETTISSPLTAAAGPTLVDITNTSPSKNDTCAVHKTIPLAQHWLKQTPLTCAAKASPTGSASSCISTETSRMPSASNSTEPPSTTSTLLTDKGGTASNEVGKAPTTPSSLIKHASEQSKPAGTAIKANETSANTTRTTVTSTSSRASSIAAVAPPVSRSRDETASSSPSKATSTGTNSTRASPSNVSPQQPQPSTQESFFKSVSKRLAQLESNSTLSLQYIEAQSLILRDAFSKVEKRQVSTTTTFLSHVNDTIMTELHGFRQAYDQLWQSTVIELEGQREQHQREMIALSSRLTLVADELVWQKRMGIVQSTLLLLCLAMVLFNRGAGVAGTNALEIPLLQHMLAKSSAAFRESPPNSPSPDSRSPVSLFRRKLWRHHTEPASGNVTDGTDSRPQSQGGPGVSVNLEPPTPTSMPAQSEVEDDDLEDEWKDVHEEMQTQSGPATPNGVRENRPPSWPGERPVVNGDGDDVRPRGSLNIT